MVAMLRGAKRYILTPPTSCAHLNLIRIGSTRRLDTRRLIGLIINKRDSVLAGDCGRHRHRTQEGEILYIPSYWIHYITS